MFISQELPAHRTHGQIGFWQPQGRTPKKMHVLALVNEASVHRDGRAVWETMGRAVRFTKSDEKKVNKTGRGPGKAMMMKKW